MPELLGNYGETVDILIPTPVILYSFNALIQTKLAVYPPKSILRVFKNVFIYPGSVAQHQCYRCRH